jgi:ribonuclease HII
MRRSAKKSSKFVIGIDEVGRGPIAGPVAVGAFVVLEADATKRRIIMHRLFKGAKESKQLSPEAREKWFTVIEKARADGHIDFHVAFQSNKVIDSKGISHAIRTALAETLEKFISIHGFSPDQCSMLLDGGLKAPTHFINQKTIIKGDAKESVIALASICAKVMRDRMMVAYAKKYPSYGFEVHKGYGTKKHYAVIRKMGVTSLHRKSWIK